MITRLSTLLLALAFGPALCLAQEGILILEHPPADTATLEDVTLRLRIRETFRDSFGAPVVYTAKADAGTGSVAIVGDSLEYTPPADWSGSTVITLFGQADQRANFVRFHLVIHPVNDAPGFQGTWDLQTFRNDDSLQLDFTGKVRDPESPFSLALRVDSIPGCVVRTEGLKLVLRAPGRVETGELRLRLADPEGSLSPYLAIPFDPNAPMRGDTLALAAGPPPDARTRTYAFALPGTGFAVVKADSEGIALDSYLADGRKVHATQRARFPGVKPSHQAPRILPMGGGYLAEIHHRPTGSAEIRSALCLFDAGLQVVNTLEPAGRVQLWVAGADAHNGRIYVRRMEIPASGPGQTTLEAYDSRLEPLPEPAFAADFLGESSSHLQFEAGRTLLLQPRNRIHPLEIGVMVFSVDGTRTDSTVLRLDHVPAEEGLLPELRGYLLAPFRGGYCLFAGIQDILPSPGGGHSAAWKDYRTLRRKFDPSFRALGTAQPWERDPSDALYPAGILAMDGGHMLVTAAQDHSFRREYRQYLHRFDAEMEPTGPGDLRVVSSDTLALPAEFARITGDSYAELLQYVDGRRLVVMRRFASAPVRLGRRPSGGNPRSRQAPNLIVRDNGTFDVLGKSIPERP